MNALSSQEFAFFAGLIREQSGIVLGAEKTYLLESRLAPLMRARGFSGLQDLIRSLKSRPSSDLLNSVVDAMTTNESFFFRDGRPFELFKSYVLPLLSAQRTSTRRLRLWSAASSTGQEPYSLAMCWEEVRARFSNLSLEIVASDLSEDALSRARAGRYTSFEVQRGLPNHCLHRFFRKEGGDWVVEDGLRRLISFRQHNLLNDPKGLGSFDVVFLRNVLIYFDVATKQKILSFIHRCIADDGFLVLGGTETVLGVTDLFAASGEHRGLFVKTG